MEAAPHRRWEREGVVRFWLWGVWVCARLCRCVVGFGWRVVACIYACLWRGLCVVVGVFGGLYQVQGGVGVVEGMGVHSPLQWGQDGYLSTACG